MAQIFYFRDRGTPKERPIYGVHGDTEITVPDNIATLRVDYHQDNVDEHNSVVDTSSGTPVLVAKSISTTEKITRIEQQNKISAKALREFILAVGDGNPAIQDLDAYKKSLVAKSLIDPLL